ncbi:hypothetical protein [Enterococcus olivae]
MKNTSTFLHSFVTDELWHSFKQMGHREQQSMEIFALAALSIYHPEQVDIQYQSVLKKDGTTELCYTIKTTLEGDSYEHAPSL